LTDFESALIEMFLTVKTLGVQPCEENGLGILKETTRIEDIAYCPMGLFKVNMPLLYGERERAFLHSQEEILKLYDDHSLFALEMPATQADVRCGILASSPTHSLESRNIVPFLRTEFAAPYFMTNRCISMSPPMLEVNVAYAIGYLAMLDCRDGTDARGPLGIFLFLERKRFLQQAPSAPAHSR